MKRKWETPYLNLNNQLFDRALTLRDAYRILEAFVVQYNARGESSTVALMTDIGIGPKNETCDPAQIYDFARVAGTVLHDAELIAAADRGSDR